MTDLGQTPPPAAPAEPDDSPDIPMWLIVVCVLALVVGGGVLAVALVTGKEETKKPSYPAAWDARILPYVKIVQKERGLTFLHPVAVRFLPSAEFEKGVRTDEKDLDKDDRTEIRQFTGLMRALGLIKGDIDLFAAFNDASGSGTLAYYAFADQRITIRGDRITPAVKPTLVHELTHALQDQQFAIGKRKKQLAKKKSGDADTESSVLDAIVEGDAERVATAYRRSLSRAQRKALAASEKRQNQEADKGLKKVPKVVLTLIGSPYVLGEAMVQTVAADGGNRAVDKLFRDTPTHESSLLDPFEVLAGNLDAKKVAVPGLEKGEKKFESGELGVLTWYLILAERIGLTDALATVDGWGGDAFVAFERDGRSCARIAYLGDSERDTTRMLGALRRWVKAAPGTPASVVRAGRQVRFESCDPGTRSKVGKDASNQALELATVRNYLALGIMRADVPPKMSRCIAGRLIQEYPVRRLADPKFGSGDSAVRDRVRQFALACR